MRAHGYPVRQNPILDRLDHVENRDALIEVIQGTDWDGVDKNGNDIHGPMFHALEQEWPVCDAIVGNPPFLGGSKKGGELGREYFDALNQVFAKRVPGVADLVCYWFEKARAHIAAGKCTAAGLVATNSIRGGANRQVLDRIVESGRIFEAWSDEEWVNDGAAVRVSLVCFSALPRHSRAGGNPLLHLDSGLPTAPGMTTHLNGVPSLAIHADLTAGNGLNLSVVKALP